MRAVTRYQANDGSEWATEAQAQKRDAEVGECAAIEAILGPRPKLDNDESHQHDPETVQRFHRTLIAHLRDKEPSWAFWPNTSPEGDEVHPWSVVGRLLDGGGPLSRLWHRRMCIGADAKEWNQPFFTRASWGLS